MLACWPSGVKMLATEAKKLCMFGSAKKERQYNFANDGKSCESTRKGGTDWNSATRRSGYGWSGYSLAYCIMEVTTMRKGHSRLVTAVKYQNPISRKSRSSLITTFLFCPHACLLPQSAPSCVPPQIAIHSVHFLHSKKTSLPPSSSIISKRVKRREIQNSNNATSRIARK